MGVKLEQDSQGLMTEEGGHRPRETERHGDGGRAWSETSHGGPRPLEVGRDRILPEGSSGAGPSYPLVGSWPLEQGETMFMLLRLHNRWTFRRQP